MNVEGSIISQETIILTDLLFFLSLKFSSFLWSNETSFSFSDSKADSCHFSVHRRNFDDENNFSRNY